MSTFATFRTFILRVVEVRVMCRFVEERLRCVCRACLSLLLRMAGVQQTQSTLQFVFDVVLDLVVSTQTVSSSLPSIPTLNHLSLTFDHT